MSGNIDSGLCFYLMLENEDFFSLFLVLTFLYFIKIITMT